MSPAVAHPEALEQVGPVGADVPGGVDREPPEVPLPLVARVARPDGASGLVGDEVAVEQLVERQQRSGRDDLAEVRMVEDEQVVLLGQDRDRGVGERLQRTGSPVDPDPGLGLEARRGREQRVAPALVVPGDALELGRAVTLGAGGGRPLRRARPLRAARFRWAVAA